VFFVPFRFISTCLFLFLRFFMYLLFLYEVHIPGCVTLVLITSTFVSVALPVTWINYGWMLCPL
jgi:hypothetical protein